MLLSLTVVQVLLRITAATGRVGETLQAVNRVVHAIRRLDEGAEVHISTDVEDGSVVWLYEEWPTPERCERHLQSQEFARLLALVETSKEPPLLEWRLVTESRGLEYFAAVRGVDASLLPAERPGRAVRRVTSARVDTASGNQ